MCYRNFLVLVSSQLLAFELRAQPSENRGISASAFVISIRVIFLHSAAFSHIQPAVNLWLNCALPPASFLCLWALFRTLISRSLQNTKLGSWCPCSSFRLCMLENCSASVPLLSNKLYWVAFYRLYFFQYLKVLYLLEDSKV